MNIHSPRWPLLTTIGVVATMLAWATSTAVESPPAAVAASSGTLTGQVFHDYDSDGARDAGEVGVAGVTIRAVDSSGTVVATTTSATNGSYSLPIASARTDDVRVEFDTPNGFSPSFAGPDAGPSVQFATVSATNVNFAVHKPDEFCQANPTVYTACYYPGTTSWNGTLGSLRSNTWTQRGGVGTTVRQKAETGAVWGVATHRQNRLVFTSAVIRRHASLGPEGLGGLYVTDADTGSLVASFDLEAEFPSVVSLSAGTDYSDTARGITADNYSLDLVGYAGVGVEGIGDIDITPDGRFLYLTNLGKQSVIRIELGGTPSAPTLLAATEFAVPGSLCGSAVPRPWGLEILEDDTIAVGMACSDLVTYASTITTAEAGVVADDGVIARLDTFAPSNQQWSALTPITFAYPRQTDFCNGSADTSTSATPECLASRWHPWTNDWVDIRSAAIVNQNNMVIWPQPMVMDIETLDDGSFVVGLNDRLSMQLGKNYQPTNTTDPAIYTWVHGDAVLLCRSGVSWVQESGGGCAGDSTYTSTRSMEFFTDLVHHNESVLGGLTVNPFRGDDTIALAVMDPNTINSSGLIFDRLTNGDIDGTGVTLVELDSASSNNPTFQKAASLGDLEVLCDMAPVQIGDRLWYDADRDGVQDAGERPIAGVTVNLYDATGTTLLGTAVTDADGRYLFDSTLTADTNTADNTGGGISAGSGYVIRFDEPTDYADGGPLAGYVLTSNAAGSHRGTDSNATPSGRYAQITVGPLRAGVNDHTFDAGFHVPPPPPPPSQVQGTTTTITESTTTTEPPAATDTAAATGTVSVGDYVWIDTDRDGRQDPGETPLPGATLTITNPDGSPVLDADGVPVGPIVTGADGRYLFTDLPPGQYRVTISYPLGYSPTLAGQGDNEFDSSSFTVLSRVLAAGEADLTLDFGVVALPTALPATGGGASSLRVAVVLVALGVLAAAVVRRRGWRAV